MKRFVLRSIVISVVVTLFCAYPAFAQESTPFEKLNYVSVKAGVYVPTSDLEEFDNGFYTDVMYNRYLSRYAAVEAGFGLYGVKATFNGSGPLIGSYTEEDTISVLPVMFNVKGILPFPAGEFYLGGGVGIYFAGLDSDITSTNWGAFSVSDGDVVIGGQIKAGLIFNLNERFFLGVEGTYMVTDTAEFTWNAFGVKQTTEVDLTGYTINGMFGFRF